MATNVLIFALLLLVWSFAPSISIPNPNKYCSNENQLGNSFSLLCMTPNKKMNILTLYLEQVKLFAVLVVSFWCNIWTSRPVFSSKLSYIPEFYRISTCLRYFKYCFSSNSILLILCTWKVCLLSRLFKNPYMTLTFNFFCKKRPKRGLKIWIITIRGQILFLNL